MYPSYPCTSGDAHTYDTHQAEYLGSGNFQFCEWLYSDGGSITYSYQCRSSPGAVIGDSGDSPFASYPNYSTYMRDAVVNNDNNRHTIQGWSTW